MDITNNKTGIVIRTSGAVLMRTKLGPARMCLCLGNDSTHIWAIFGGMGGESDMIADGDQANYADQPGKGRSHVN
jgi:hypothetical protein